MEFTKFSAEVDVDFEVKVSLVSVVGLHFEYAEDLLALLAGNVVVQVEDGLLPVSVRCLRGSGEADALVAFREFNVEERHQGLERDDKLLSIILELRFQ